MGAQVEVFTAPRPAKPVVPVKTETAPARATAVAARAEPAAAQRATITMAPVRALPAQFTYKNRAGQVVAAPIVDRYQAKRIVSPLARTDPRINPKLARAATIAQDRAHARSKSRCWRYVKNALLASGAISSYPKTAYAKQAGEELVRSYGFKKLPIRDPYKAPVGAVLVYGSRRAAGHVEIRTKTGFVSDFKNKKPSPRPLIGIYAKA